MTNAQMAAVAALRLAAMKATALALEIESGVVSIAGKRPDAAAWHKLAEECEAAIRGLTKS